MEVSQIRVLLAMGSCGLGFQVRGCGHPQNTQTLCAESGTKTSWIRRQTFSLFKAGVLKGINERALLIFQRTGLVFVLVLR